MKKCYHKPTEKDHLTRGRVIRKSYALTSDDLEYIKRIQSKCLNQKIVLSDSHVIRVALWLAEGLSEESLIKASMCTPKVIKGRPKAS